MCRLELIARLNDSKRVIERLQRRGVLELTAIDDDRLVTLNTAEGIRQFQKSKSTLEASLETFEKYAPQNQGLISSLMPKGKDAYELREFADKAENLDKILHQSRKVLTKRNEIASLEADIGKYDLTCATLEDWKDLDVPTNIRGTDSTATFIGSMQRAVTAEELSSILGDGAYVETVFSDKRYTDIFVICLKDKQTEVANKLRDEGFLPLSETSMLTPSQRINECTKLKEQANKRIEELIREITELSKYRKDFEFFIDYLEMKKDKYAALSKAGMTQNIIVIQGYIAEKYTEKLRAEFEKKYDCFISFSEPNEDEDVPVLLENSKFSEPVEGITEMYALPGKKDIDPTSVMSFFYYLFFGMMLSDAGYGILMVIGTAIALRKFEFEDKMRKTLKMFQYCGISTIFWGAMFGSWFGDIIQVVAREFFNKEIKSVALWFQPLDDPMKLLLFSFLLGIIHLFLGLITNFGILWKRGEKFNAFCDVVPIMMTVAGVAPLAAGILTSGIPEIVSKIGGYVAIVGVALIVLTAGRASKSIPMRFFGGIYGLYNVATGYLSDILSYSRLLALGLATGSIASVINLIGTMPSNPVVKVIMLVIVFIIGHAANLAINLLGAYVHTDRLQFVELFSKFYEGGGRAFEPLKINTKYIKFKEENKNE